MSMKTHYADRTLTMSRLYDAPRAAVFDAWINTLKVQEWWGCADTTKVRSEIEPRIGGKFCHVMTIHGADHNAVGVIIACDPPARLAYELAATDFSPKMTVDVGFAEEDGKTRVTLAHSGLPDALSPIVQAGWTAALGKLGDFLLLDAA